MANIEMLKGTARKYAALIIGPAITLGSVVDGVASGGFKAYADEMGKRIELSESMQDKYGVESFCAPDLGGTATTCFEGISGDKTKEESTEILHEYHEELSAKQAEIPSDPRGVLDVTGVGLGAVATIAGAFVKKSKEEKK